MKLRRRKCKSTAKKTVKQTTLVANTNCIVGSMCGLFGWMPRNHRVAMITSGTSSTPTIATTAPIRARRCGSSMPLRSTSAAEYMAQRTNAVVKRGSQVHHVFQAEWAHSEPVTSVRLEHSQPISKAARDQWSHARSRRARYNPPVAAMSTNDASPIQATETWR